MNPAGTSPKVIAPRLRAHLIRARLIHSLQQNRDRRLVLIVGQAAQGKSTLAVSYVNTMNTPCAWVNLDPEDSDPATLLHLLAESIRHGLKTPLQFSFDFPPAPSNPKEQAFIYRDWAQSLFRPLAVPISLVMDGLDRLESNAASFRFLAVLIREAPPNVQLLMLSREIPPLDVMSLKMLQEVYIVNNEELAFTIKETGEFLRKCRGMVLTPEAIRKIHRLTAGWIGGLILLSESLSQMAGESGEIAFLDALPDHLSKEVFQYFGEAIFASQPHDVQDFLIRSSVAETIEPELVRELTGADGAHAILRNLSRRNLFVQVTYDRDRGWLYCYHQLFRDFLQDKFKTTIDEETGRQLLQGWGTLQEQRGELEDALKCFLKAKAYVRAVSVIQEIGMDLLKQGRSADLAKWIKGLPEDLIQANPWLLFYRFMTGRLAASKEYLLNLLRAFELFQEKRDIGGQILSLAYLIKARNSGGLASIPVIPSLLILAEHLLQSVPPDRYPYERAVLWLQVGFAHYLRSGSLRKAYSACQNAYQLAQYLGEIPLQLNALIHSHSILSLLGELPKAKKLGKKVESLLKNHPHSEMRVLHLLNLIQLATFEGDAKNAADLMEMAKQEIDQHGFTHLKPLATLYELWVKNRLGEYDETVELAKSLAFLTTAMGNWFLVGNAFLHSGMSHYQKEDYLKAKEALERARDIFFSKEGGSVLHLDITKALLTMTCRHLQQDLGSEKGLEEILAHFEEGGSHFFLTECHLAMALISRQQSRTEETIRHLRAGIEIMKERGYEQLLLLNREDFLESCILALELQVDGAMDYAAHLLSSRLADRADGELKRLSHHPDARVAASAMKVARKIHRSALPQLRIETLGRFQVYRGDAPIGEEDWVARQPRLLLMAIVAHGSRGVPKEFLMEALWPDPQPCCIENNFKVILHKLRRILEPNMHENSGSSYIHLKSSLVSLDQGLCLTDVDDFLALMKDGQRKEKSGDIKGALSAYREAEGSYQGDFLPEEPSRLWADVKREELRAKYIELLTRLAAIYEKRGALTKASWYYTKIIHTDPLLEEPYQKLMVLYSSAQKVSSALRVYEDCKRTFRERLDLEPDELTSSIYSKLLESCPRC